MPEEYIFDINKMEFKDGYKKVWTGNYDDGSRIMEERKLTDEQKKVINNFKSLILKFERIVNNMNTMGNGTKELEEEALKQQENDKLEKVIEKVTKKVLKMVEVTDRKIIQVGDYLTLKHHGHYWKVTGENMRQGTWQGVKETKKTFTYEIVGSELRGYQELKNPLE